MFYWSWLFHNAVNSRIGKDYVDYNTAWDMYSDDEMSVCTSNCGKEPGTNIHSKVTPIGNFVGSLNNLSINSNRGGYLQSQRQYR